MRARPTTRRARIRAALTLFIALAAPALIAPSAHAQAGTDRKMQREIRMMERSLDDMLVDSPNFLVPGYDNARGIYVPGTGMIFTFKSSLTASRNFTINGKRGWMFWDDEEGRDEDRESRRGTRSRGMAREERQYKRGTDELMELLLDEADSFTTLKAGEWVQLIAFFDDVDYLFDKDVDHLALKVKVDDLRAFADKKLSEEQAKAKMVKDEY